MQALYYVGPEQVEMRETEELPLAEGESRVRILARGILPFRSHAFHGHDARRQPPLFWGTKPLVRCWKALWRAKE